MKIKLLGTGTSQGVPVIGCECEVCKSTDPLDKRLRCSVYIETEFKHIIIDTGPDFRAQCLNNGIKKLDCVLITHEHKDHVGGLDDIRPFNYQQNKDIEVYCTLLVEQSLKKQFDYIFADIQYPGIPKITIKHINHQPFTIGDIIIEPIPVLHHKLPVLGFKINRFAYITDANFIAEAEIDKLKGCEILILDALHHQPHISHFNLEQAKEMALKIGAKQTFFTHISHHMGLHKTINNQLPLGMQLAYDGMEFEIKD